MQDGAFEGLHSDLGDRILKIFFAVYNELGDGFLESVYRRSMALALQQNGLHATEEAALPVYFRQTDVGVFFADIVVERSVILELKACDAITKQHKAQLTHYLRSTTIEVGYVLAFGDKPRFERSILTNDRKRNLVRS